MKYLKRPKFNSIVTLDEKTFKILIFATFKSSISTQWQWLKKRLKQHICPHKEWMFNSASQSGENIRLWWVCKNCKMYDDKYIPRRAVNRQMIKIKVRHTHTDEIVIHYEAALGYDFTLCGASLDDDDYGVTELEETNKRVTCPDCIRIVKYVRGQK